MLDVGGQDSTEAFEDVGHSDEAREILEGLLVGKLKRQVCLPFLPSPSFTTHLPATSASSRSPRKKEKTRAPAAPRRMHADSKPQAGDPKPKSYAQPGASSTTTDGASTGVGLYAIILLGGALAFGAFKYLQSQGEVAQ